MVGRVVRVAENNEFSLLTFARVMDREERLRRRRELYRFRRAEETLQEREVEEWKESE